MDKEALQDWMALVKVAIHPSCLCPLCNSVHWGVACVAPVQLPAGMEVLPNMPENFRFGAGVSPPPATVAAPGSDPVAEEDGPCDGYSTDNSDLDICNLSSVDSGDVMSSTVPCNNVGAGMAVSETPEETTHDDDGAGMAASETPEQIVHDDDGTGMAASETPEKTAHDDDGAGNGISFEKWVAGLKYRELQHELKVRGKSAKGKAKTLRTRLLAAATSVNV